MVGGTSRTGVSPSIGADVTHTLTIATRATSAPMGQQVYEEEVAGRAQAALGRGVVVSRMIARSMRSDLPGNTRLPDRALEKAPAIARQAVGRLVYPRADVVHRMGLTLPPARVPEILTIHDTVSWRFPDESPPPAHATREARRAAAVIAPSQFSADDIGEMFGLDHVDVIPNGVETRFFDAPALDAGALAALGITGTYVLHAGGSSLRKNLEGLAMAWPLVHSMYPDVTLVLSGPPTRRRHALFAHLPNTLLVGRVAAADVPGLIAGADAVVVPSLHEGFGLPALEAMAAGVVVVAADRSSLPEVCGGAAVLVEPDGRAIADGLVHALAGGGEIDRLVAAARGHAARFTWEASVTRHAAVWNRVLGSGKAPEDHP